MSKILNFKKVFFLVYGLGSTGNSVVNYFKRNNITNYVVWDDSIELRKKFKKKIVKNLNKSLNQVDYIVLSPGISLEKTKHKKYLNKFKKKIITDIDLLYLSNKKFKSVVVTGSNGKSTTCKMINHLLRKNKYQVAIGGNIGTPVLNLKLKRNIFLVIEASSFQLSHSKFIHPNYAILLNITNDHVDWHGSMNKYIKSKFKIFNLQNKTNFAFINRKLKKKFKKNKYSSKLISLKSKEYKKIRSKINNNYLTYSMNEENMIYVYSLSKLLKIKKNSFLKAMNSFEGLPHRYEFFLKKNKNIFINDSKATSFQATKFALQSSKNIYWILGGLPKEKDKINLKNLKKNIIKSYIIGKNANFFKNQLKNKVPLIVTKNIKNSIIKVLQDIQLSSKINNTILLSPAAASYDQFKNFEIRGNHFKRLSKLYSNTNV